MKTSFLLCIFLTGFSGSLFSQIPARYVTNSNNDGPGSLRQAILDANANANSLERILFNIQGTGPHTIQPTSPLPEITDPVVIDGYSQPGASAATGSGNAVLMIELDGTNAGTEYEASGLTISAGSSTVRGLVINRFYQYGIKTTTLGNNRIEGNFLGTDVTGTLDLGNSQSGLWSQGDGDIIGGTSPEARNILSGNGSRGLIISGNGTFVQGNYIGTDITGTVDLGNESTGIYIREQANNCIIGGAERGAGNLISGNSSGIFMNSHLGNTPSGHVIQGNRIGTDITGNAPLGNTYNGITIADGDRMRIGGANPGEGNVIAFNGATGVTIVEGKNNALRANEIHSNGQIGINLGDYAYQVTPNDPGDEDTGPNDYQNFPVLTDVASDAVSTTFVGTLNSLPNTSYTIDFFSNTSPDPSGFGEGETYLGSAELPLGANGYASFNISIPVSVSQGSFITSTATSPDGNSSEFSEAILFTSSVSYEKSFEAGWNWFSVNVQGEDMSLGNLLTCVSNEDYIKNQTQSATFYEGHGWYGSLEEAGDLDPRSLYKIKTADPCGITFTGVPVDPFSTPIDLVSGWNWIAYLPQCILPTASALAPLSLNEEDYIKNQTESATYYTSYGWYGSLEDLTPGEGYMFYKTGAESLFYPECPAVSHGIPKNASIEKMRAGTALNPHQFAFTGSVTAKVFIDGVPAGSEDNLLLAYVDDQLRGTMEGKYFKPAQAYAYPIMIFSNLGAGETITFKYYDTSKDELYHCNETLAFTKDMIVANAFDAFELNASSVGSEENMDSGMVSLSIYPNPFNDVLYIAYSLPEKSEIKAEVFDLTGRFVTTLKNCSSKPGTYTISWNAATHPDGTYLLKLSTAHYSLVKKVILLR